MAILNDPGLYESSDIPEAQKDRLRVAGKELAIGVDYDVIDFTYPTTVKEVFVYLKSGTPILTIEVTYTSSSKKDLLKVEVI